MGVDEVEGSEYVEDFMLFDELFGLAQGVGDYCED